MKVPILGLHVVTSRRLEQIRAAARAEGVAAGVKAEKKFSAVQIAQLLGKPRKPIRMINRKRT